MNLVISWADYASRGEAGYHTDVGLLLFSAQRNPSLLLQTHDRLQLRKYRSPFHKGPKIASSVPPATYTFPFITVGTVNLIATPN